MKRMEKINEIVARIRTVSSYREMMNPDAIEAASYYVWLRAVNEIDRSKVDVVPRDGRPGFHWSGAQLSLINDLFPAIEGGYRYTPDEANDFRRAVNQYLRTSGNMTIRKRGGYRIKSVWWISEHWTGLKVTHVGEQFSEEDSELSGDDHEDETTASEYPCRVCNTPFTLHHVRVAHERRDHLKAFQKDGTVLELREGRMRPEELRALVIEIAKGASAPETLTYFFRKARLKDLRAVEARVSRMVLDLADDPGQPLRRAESLDRYPRFEYDASVQPGIVSLLESLGHLGDPQDPLAEHISTLEGVVRGLRAMGQIQGDLLYLQSKLDDVTCERDGYRQELEEITQERDKLQRTLDMLRAQLLGEKG